MRRIGIVLIGTLALVACKKKSARLTSDNEIAAIENQINDEIAAAKTRTCQRPVLRGQALPGPAEAAVMAIAKPEGALATCLAAFKGDGLRAELMDCAGQGGCKQRALDDPATQAPSLAKADAACDELVATFSKAASYEDSCSVAALGRPLAGWADYLPLMTATRAADLRVRTLANAGKPAAALQLDFDILRVAQDLHRGGGGLIATAIAGAMRNQTAQLAQLVLTSKPLSAAELDELAGEADILAASEVPFGSALGDDGRFTELYDILPALKEASWSPPGGDTHPRPTLLHVDGIDPRDFAILQLITIEQIRREAMQACPLVATAEACFAGLGGAGPGVDVPSREAPDLSTIKKGSRAAILKSMAEAGKPHLGGFVVKHAHGVAMVMALRVHLAALRLAAKNGHCPAAADYAQPPLEPLLHHAQLQGPLTATAAGDDVVLSLPAGLAGKDGAEIWRVRCPK